MQGAPDRLRAGDVSHVSGLEPIETFQPVGVDRRPRRNVVSDEREHRRLFEVRDHGHADPTRPIPASFHRHQHQRGFPPLELATAAQAGLGRAHPGVIDLHVAVQGLPPRVHHRAPQLVQQQPRRFVPPQAQLPLQQERREAPLVGNRQIGRPEPHQERRLRVVENRPGGQRHLIPARRTLPAPVCGQAIAARVPAPGTHKAVRPAARRQVVLTGLVGRKLPLKLPEILRKRRARHADTLPVVAC